MIERIRALVAELRASEAKHAELREKYQPDRDTAAHVSHDISQACYSVIADQLEAILADSGGWRADTKDAPQEPFAWIVVRCEEVYRWAPYKPQAVHQMRKTGRWQKLNDYGGFDNAELPMGVQWKPHRTEPPPQEPPR